MTGLENQFVLQLQLTKKKNTCHCCLWWFPTLSLVAQRRGQDAGPLERKVLIDRGKTDLESEKKNSVMKWREQSRPFKQQRRACSHPLPSRASWWSPDDFPECQMLEEDSPPHRKSMNIRQAPKSMAHYVSGESMTHRGLLARVFCSLRAVLGHPQQWPRYHEALTSVASFVSVHKLARTQQASDNFCARAKSKNNQKIKHQPTKNNQQRKNKNKKAQQNNIQQHSKTTTTKQ